MGFIIYVTCMISCGLGMFMLGRINVKEYRQPEIDNLIRHIEEQNSEIYRNKQEIDELKYQIEYHRSRCKFVEDTLTPVLTTSVRPSRNSSFGYDWTIGEHEGMASTQQEAMDAVIEWSKREVSKRKNATTQAVKESRQ